LVAEIARGGMGVVYLASTSGLGGFNKLIAVKELMPEYVEDPAFVGMFLDEARLAALLNHPNVVQTFEVGQSGARIFMAMEYLDGRPLHRVIQRFQKKGLVFPLAMHLRAMCEALEGLHYAHELTDFGGTPFEIVHRDVSPQNVFITFGGGIKIVDFGIAKARDSRHETRGGVMKGKIAYMAPEQAQGEKVTRRADVYSAGVMLWEALVGRRLWQGKNEVEIVSKLLLNEVPSPETLNPNAPMELVKVCRKAMALKPEDRYATAGELHEEIEKYLRGAGDVSAREVSVAVADLFAEERKAVAQVIEQQFARLHSDNRGELARIDVTSGSSGPGNRSPGNLSPVTPISDVMGAEARAINVTRGAENEYAAVEVGDGKPNRRRLMMIGAGVLAVVLGIGAAALVKMGKSTPPPPPPTVEVKPVAPAVPPAPTVTPPAQPAAPTTVSVSIQMTPAEARVMIDDLVMDTNPVHARFPKGEAKHIVHAFAPGFVSKEREVVFDDNLVLDFSLDRAPQVPMAHHPWPHHPGTPIPTAPPSIPANMAPTTTVPAGMQLRDRPASKRAIDTANPYDEK
jgi:serine/threonine-protein kinase